MGLEKDMALEKRHGAGKKGMALGKMGMARRHAKRGWGKHYTLNKMATRAINRNTLQRRYTADR